MRVMTSSLLASAALVFVFASTAQAQYFYEGPQKPEVEIDLSVLNDMGQAPPAAPQPYAPAYVPPPAPAYSGSEYPAPITAAVPPAHVEQAPLPPMVSPYENSRVIDRVELDSSNPYIDAQPAPSPFNPPALIKPPKPRTESPRTAPATVFKPAAPSAIDGGAPVVVEAAPEQGVEMPAIVVTQDVVESKKRTAGNKPKIIVKKPVRKPAVLTLAREETAPIEAAVEPPQAPAAVIEETAPAIAELSPLEQAAEPPAPQPAEVTPPVDVAEEITPPMPEPATPPVTAEVEEPLPEVQKTAEMVIDDLYTLPTTVNETAPPRNDPPVPDNAATQTIAFQNGSAALDDQQLAAIDTLADKLDDTANSRLLIKGYASGADGDRAAARRLSVSRALAVRSHLMDKGIQPSRVDVRGLGVESDTANAAQLDRVDLVLIP